MIAKFGLLGGKLGHSLSPFIHNLLFEASGMRAEYKLYEAKSVQEFLNNYPTLDGFNITIPYKKDIVCHCTKLDKSAKSLGVVNCVDKNMVGYNTDVYGYTKSVGELGINNNSKVLLLGCGGVGSMIAKQYKPENLVIAVRNISKEKVNRIKLEFGNVEVIDIAKLKDEFNDLVEQNDALNVNNLICEEQFDLVVNSTPCGMYPNVEDSPIDENAVKLAKACYDTIYNPYTTKLLEISQQAGLKCKNGLEMLVLQAVKSHEYWYGGSFKQNDIEQIISLTAKELEK